MPPGDRQRLALGQGAHGAGGAEAGVEALVHPAHVDHRVEPGVAEQPAAGW